MFSISNLDSFGCYSFKKLLCFSRFFSPLRRINCAFIRPPQCIFRHNETFFTLGSFSSLILNCLHGYRLCIGLVLLLHLACSESQLTTAISYAFLIVLHLFIVCVHMCVYVCMCTYLQQLKCGGPAGSLFSPSTIQEVEIKLRLSGLVSNTLWWFE